MTAVYPSRGIIAGGSAATIELKLAIHGMMANLKLSHPSITFEVYIADIAIEGCHHSQVSLRNAITKASKELRSSCSDRGWSIAGNKAMIVTR